jgi:glycosyltransferase involved in cell wall biosynthesis
MNLLIIDEELIGGGVETLRRRLLPELAKLVARIVWVVPGHALAGFRDIEAVCENVRLEPLHPPAGAARVRQAVARRLHGEIPRTLLNARLRSLADKHQSDLCFTTCAFAQPIPETGLPVIGFVSDINPALPSRVIDNIAIWIDKSAATFAVSDFTCAELKRLRPRRAGTIHSVPLAAPAAVTASIGRQSNLFYYPAAPNKHKGHMVLLEAARRLAGAGLIFRLVLTGAGMDAGGNGMLRCIREFVANHAELLGGCVTIAGDAPPEEVERLFMEASCIVLPSTYEGFGLPLAEALAHGKRVICADIPPFREQIERYRCEALATFVPPADSRAIAEAMAAHLKAPAIPGMTCEVLQERLSRWTWADTARRCRELMEEVMAGA